MFEILRKARRRVQRAYCRYTRPIPSVPLGNVTVERQPARAASRAYFDLPGLPANVPRASLSGVLAGGEPFRLLPRGDYAVLQGGCTDGRYAYLALENQRMVREGRSPFAECLLAKVDMNTWELAGVSASLPINHGNDLAYNPRTGQLLVVHCEGRPNHISFIDPGTLEISETREYYHSVYGIAYNEGRDQYVMAVKGAYDFAIFDRDFQLLRYVKGVDTRFVKQGIDCDDEFIYFSMSEKNSIVCYDWAGNYRGVFAVRGCDREVENIFHVGDDWYISYNLQKGSGGAVYRLHFDRSELAG